MNLERSGYMSNILIVAAHPDDEILGCGGMMARITRSDSQRVSIGYLSLGMTSRQDTDALAEFEKEKVKDRSRNAMEALTGMPKQEMRKHLKFANFPDNKFDTVPLLDIVKQIEKWIQEIKPDVIFTHSQKDLNIDHCITHRAVLTATRPIKGNHSVNTIYSFSIPSSTEWTFGSFGVFTPNVFIDITGMTAAKVKALQCYDTEIRQFPHPRSEEYMHFQAFYMGSIVGMDEAEGYEMVRGFI